MLQNDKSKILFQEVVRHNINSEAHNQHRHTCGRRAGVAMDMIAKRYGQ